MQPAFSLQDKVIVVTGGTGILGDAFLQAIVAAGGTVAILGRNADLAQQRAAAIRAGGGQALAVVADMLGEDQLHAACQQVLAAFVCVEGGFAIFSGV